MKYERESDGSYLHNCLLKWRPEQGKEAMFRIDNGSVKAYLNGYAIIPLEEYYELTQSGITKEDMIKIRQADRDLGKVTI